MEGDERDGGDWQEEYARRKSLFEFEHGEIVLVHWSEKEAAGAAVTAQVLPRRWPLGPPPIVFQLHRDTAFVTDAMPKLEAALYDGDELAVRAGANLSGDSQRAVMNGLLAAAAEVVGVLTQSSNRNDDELAERLMNDYRQRLDRVEQSYTSRAVRSAQLLYLRGALRGVFVWTLTALLGGMSVWALSPGVLSKTSVATAIGCAAAGAIGALTSVIWRVTARAVVADYELSRYDLMWLGSFRPLLGAAFGVAFYCALRSGILNIDSLANDGDVVFLYLFIGFLAGFSERLAPDVFRASEQSVIGAR